MTLKLHPKDIATIWDKGWRIQNMYKIRTEGRGLVSMVFNHVQEKLFEAAEKLGFKGIRNIILKARKEGVTTFYALFYLDDTLFTPNTTSVLIAHTAKDVQKLFKIVKLAYRTCPDVIQLSDGRKWTKPVANYDNVNELTFGAINSTIYIAIQGRGGTINNLHVSEASKIPENVVEERMAAIMESVPNIEFGTNITIETTANGMGGWFFDLWTDAVAGLNEFADMFFPWFYKKSNKAIPPKGWTPNKHTVEMNRKATKYFDVKLKRTQMFWWEQRKQRQKKLMEQEHPTIPDDAFLSSAIQVFDGELLKEFKTKEKIATRKGWRIYERPKKGRRYVVGGDPSEGGGGDNSAGVVVDAVTLKDVAVYYDKKTKPTAFAGKLHYISQYYNDAVIAPERNNHGHAVIDALKLLGANIFVEIKVDEKTNKKTKKLGWHTNTRTRDLILDKLDNALDEGAYIPNSAIIKKEMVTFITNEKGKREAKSGKNDDAIMALSIALFIATMPKRSFGIWNLD